jgi:hypothetical protein
MVYTAALKFGGGASPGIPAALEPKLMEHTDWLRTNLKSVCETPDDAGTTAEMLRILTSPKLNEIVREQDTSFYNNPITQGVFVNEKVSVMLTSMHIGRQTDTTIMHEDFGPTYKWLTQYWMENKLQHPDFITSNLLSHGQRLAQIA